MLDCRNTLDLRLKNSWLYSSANSLRATFRGAESSHITLTRCLTELGVLVTFVLLTIRNTDWHLNIGGAAGGHFVRAGGEQGGRARGRAL